MVSNFTSAVEFKRHSQLNKLLERKDSKKKMEKKLTRNEPRARIDRIKPKEVAKKYATECKDPPGFEVKMVDAKIGRGIYSTRSFDQGDFLLEYAGKIISGKNASSIKDTNYTYHFWFKGENKCIDATKEPVGGPKYGRLVNHGDYAKDRNAVMKIVEVEKVPHLCLFSTRKITFGEQILYDYGTKDLPWLKKTVSRKSAIPIEELQTIEETSSHDGDKKKTKSFQEQEAEVIDVITQESITLQNDTDDNAEEESIFDDSDRDPDFKPDSEESDSPYETVSGSESDTSDVYHYPVLIQETNQPSVATLKDDSSAVNSTDRQKADSTNEASISVPLAKTYIDGKRVVDKYHACTYCGKLLLRIARHIQSVHRDETAVSELQQSTRQEKAKGLDKLRLDGDYKHNIKVLAENSGFLILARRPSANNVRAKYSYSDFLPCEYCKGFFLKTELWRHRQMCQFSPNETKDSSMKYTRAQSTGVLMLQASLPQNKSFNRGFMDCVISTLIVDEISLIIRNDDIILRVGENLFAKHVLKQKQYISQEIRLLGRIVKALRTINGNENGYLVDFLKPELFDQLVEAAQTLSGAVEKDHCFSYGTPSVALKCGPVLKKCCVVLKGQALRNSNELGKKNAQRGMEAQGNIRCSTEVKRNEPVLLPSARDLMKLKGYIENEITTASDYLKEHQTSKQHFQALSAAVLCRIIMFNRRRSGEASKMLAKDYTIRPNWKENLNEEIMQCLQPLEKQLVNRLDMIEIRGKRGRTVPVILTPDIKESLDLLMKCRPLVQISEQNEYLFPRLSGTGHILGHVCMRQFALQAGLENPERIGSTSMRKYIATVIQVLNLNEVEVEWLSNHLGHSVDVHREFYRNQETAVELGRIAKLLLAVDGGHPLTQGVDEDSLNKLITQDDEDDAGDDSEDEEDMDDDEDLQSEKDTDIHIQNLEQRKRSVRKIVHWTKDENAAIERQFGKFLRLLKVPGKLDCEKALGKEPVLRNRDWATIKYRVYNTIKRLRKGKT